MKHRRSWSLQTTDVPETESEARGIMNTAHENTYVRDNTPDTERQPVFGPMNILGRIPERYNASSLLDQAVANGYGDRPAIRTADGDISYADLLSRVQSFASVLVNQLGLRSGDPVLLQSPNTPAAYIAWWAILRAGGVVVSIMPMLRSEEVEKIVSKAKVELAIVDAHLLEEASKARALSGRDFPIAPINGPDGLDVSAQTNETVNFPAVATHRDDPALVAFTSGTTGEPKGCIQFHRDIAVICEIFPKHVLGAKPDDIFCCTAPMAFTFGLGASVIFPASVGACTVLPKQAGYDALAEAIDEAGVSILFTAPTAYRVLSRMAPGKFSSLRLCVSAGEHLSLETFDMWEAATGLRLVDGIGSTELMHIFLSAKPNEVRPGATGKALPGYEVKILGNDLEPLPAGEVGKLAVRGVTGCRYLDDDRQEKYVQAGWNITGDLFSCDEDGYFWFVSRADDLIVSSGYNIAAVEVEQAVLKHSQVREAAVVGVPDAERGQICKAFVVAEEGASLDDCLKQDIQNFVKQTIAPYKYPRAVEFVDQLPKTHTGKMKRSALKQAPLDDVAHQNSDIL